jgi:hypothetical protein
MGLFEDCFSDLSQEDQRKMKNLINAINKNIGFNNKNE